MFITFEGLDGSGKSTAAKYLAEYLNNRGYDVILTHEPGGTWLGQKLRDIILNGNDHPTPKAQLLLMLADRTQHVENIILPSLKDGKVVISDRYIDSTIAYQVYGMGLPIAHVKYLNAFVTNIIPNLTFFLDVSYETARERIGQDLRKMDRYEKMGKDFFERVRAGYNSLLSADRMRRIDGELDISHTTKIIQRETELLLRNLQ